MVCFSYNNIYDQLLQAVAATCIESMALQTAAAAKLPGNLKPAIANTEIVRVEQLEAGCSTVVSLLVIESMWLGDVYDGQ